MKISLNIKNYKKKPPKQQAEPMQNFLVSLWII